MQVLVAIDDSECSALALEAVSKGCWPSGTHFHIVMVIEPLSAQYAITGTQYLEAITEAQHSYLNYCQQFIGDLL